MGADVLTDREEQVLDAVIRTYVDTAGPAGSRTIAKRFPLGISPATVRNTMADLEGKGYLYHPHTSAGRIPTDLAYRYYVDTLMRPLELSSDEERRLRLALEEDEATIALARVIRHATRVVGLLTDELGVAVAPRLDEVVLEKLELVRISGEKVLLVLTLGTGMIRTIYVDLPVSVPAETLVSVTRILNERLAGQPLSEIRKTLPERLRDSVPPDDGAASELINIFLQSGDELFDFGGSDGGALHLGRTSVLANQPEFASGTELKNLLELTEERDLLAGVLGTREHQSTFKITIGEEHEQPELRTFTLITADYQVGGMSGVVGVIGPTRMPYEKVATIVDRTSSFLSDLLISPGRGASEANDSTESAT